MKNVKTKSNLFIIFFIITVFYGCFEENKKVSLEKKIIKGIEKKIVEDINEDNIKDTITLKAIPLNGKQTFDILLRIKYSYNLKFKTKIIYEHAEALFWGINANVNWLTMRYSEEHSQDNTYNIFYDKIEDEFYLTNYYFNSPNETFKQEYKIFNEGFYTAEINVLKLCKYSYNNYKIKDTLKHSDFNNKECVSIPYDSSRKTIGFVENFLNVKLEQIK